MMHTSTALLFLITASIVIGWPGDHVCRDPSLTSQCTALIAETSAEIEQLALRVESGGMSERASSSRSAQALGRMRLHLETLEAERAETMAAKEVGDAQRAADQLEACVGSSTSDVAAAEEKLDVESREAGAVKAQVESNEALELTTWNASDRLRFSSVMLVSESPVWWMSALVGTIMLGLLMTRVMTKRTSAVVTDAPTGRVLVVQDRKTNEWTLPGGCTKIGEEPSKACCRVLHAESGYKTSLVTLRDKDKDCGLFYYGETDFGSLGRAERIRIFKGRADQEETQDYGFARYKHGKVHVQDYSGNLKNDQKIKRGRGVSTHIRQACWDSVKPEASLWFFQDGCDWRPMTEEHVSLDGSCTGYYRSIINDELDKALVVDHTRVVRDFITFGDGQQGCPWMMLKFDVKKMTRKFEAKDGTNGVGNIKRRVFPTHEALNETLRTNGVNCMPY